MAESTWLDRIDLGKLNKRERMMLILTLVIVAVFLFAYLYLPILRERQATDLRISEMKASVEVLQAQVGNAREEAARSRAGQDESAQLLSLRAGELFAGGGRLSSILEEVTRLARLRRVEFVSVRPETVEDKGAYLTLTMRIDLKSRFRELGGYLLMLENLPRTMRVDDLRVESGPDFAPYVVTHLDVVTVMAKP